MYVMGLVTLIHVLATLRVMSIRVSVMGFAMDMELVKEIVQVVLLTIHVLVMPLVTPKLVNAML